MTQTESPSSPERRLVPPSFRVTFGWRLLICTACGAAAGLVGTLAHRMGAASNMPYGLALAFALVLTSAWAARSRCGVVGLGLHLFASTTVAWILAMPGPGGDVLVPVGSRAFVTFFAMHAGYLWLFGLIALQLALVLLPRRCFRMSARREPAHAPDAA